MRILNIFNAVRAACRSVSFTIKIHETSAEWMSGYVFSRRRHQVLMSKVAFNDAKGNLLYRKRQPSTLILAVYFKLIWPSVKPYSVFITMQNLCKSFIFNDLPRSQFRALFLTLARCLAAKVFPGASTDQKLRFNKTLFNTCQ